MPLPLLAEAPESLQQYCELRHKCQLVLEFSIENAVMMENFP